MAGGNPFQTSPLGTSYRTQAITGPDPLLDYLVGAGEQHGWHVEAERFSRKLPQLKAKK